VDTDADAVTLWRPTGPEELALVEASGWREWPPRLPGQPIFYPVLNEDYATKIARDWNVREAGSGYVTRFRVRRSFLDRYQVHQAGGRTILEYWIPPRTWLTSTRILSASSSWSPSTTKTDQPVRNEGKNPRVCRTSSEADVPHIK
jgi:hypothetical protein